MKLIALAILGFAFSALAQTEVVTTAAQTSKQTSSQKKKADNPNKNPFGPESKSEGPITTEIYADEAGEKRLGSSGRLLVRYSGTESLARVMVEAASAAEVEQVAAAIAHAIEQAIGERLTQATS